MRFAINKNNTRVYIDDAINEKYYCPVCMENVITRKGKINVHHFAHSRMSNCKVNNYIKYMSKWHRKWQSIFPNDNIEVIKSNNNEIRIADIILEDKKVVIEIQHSPISYDEFNDRNIFYNTMGYKVIWIFDLIDQYENDQILLDSINCYKWLHPKRIFTDYYINDNVEILLHLSLNKDENDRLLKILEKINNKIELHQIDDIFYRNHKNDTFLLIRVKEIIKYDRTYIIFKDYYESYQEFIDSL